MLFLDMPCLCKQCRSSSVGFFRSQLTGSAQFIIQYVNLYQQPGANNLTGWQLEMGVASELIQQGKGYQILEHLLYLPKAVWPLVYFRISLWVLGASLCSGGLYLVKDIKQYHLHKSLLAKFDDIINSRAKWVHNSFPDIEWAFSKVILLRNRPQVGSKLESISSWNVCRPKPCSFIFSAVKVWINMAPNLILSRALSIEQSSFSGPWK